MTNLNFYRKHGESISVYIPSTYGVNGRADKYEVNAAIEEAVELMSELFGGATVTKGIGAWTSDTAGVISESVYIVTSAAFELADMDVDRMIDFAEEIRDRFEQEAVTLEVNGAMYFIDGAHTEYDDDDYEVDCTFCGDGGCIHCSPKDFVDFPIY
jgi:hypothetical protein